MKKGKPKSSAFFPEESMVKELRRPGQVKRMPYPDKPDEIERNQASEISEISKNSPKPGYRH